MSIELGHIYRVNKTLLEMFEDRGGDIDDNLFTSGLSYIGVWLPKAWTLISVMIFW